MEQFLFVVAFFCSAPASADGEEELCCGADVSEQPKCFRRLETALGLPLLVQAPHLQNNLSAPLPLLPGVAPPNVLLGGKPLQILVVTALSPELRGYGQYAAAVNAAWARRFGHTFALDARARPEGNSQADALNMMLRSTRDALDMAPENIDWILRLDCDALLVNFQQDHLSELVSKNAWAQVLASTAVRQGVRAYSVVNFGVVMLRRSPYVVRLLEEMWNRLQGTDAIDQDVFTEMFHSNWGNLRDVTAILPETAMNSALVAITANPLTQPIYHFWGHSDDVRELVFREAHAQMCSGIHLLHLNQTYLLALAVSANASVASQSAHCANSLSGFNASEGGYPRRVWRLAAVLRHWGDADTAESWEHVGVAAAARWNTSGYKSTMWDRMELLSARIQLSTSLRNRGQTSEADAMAWSAMKSCNDDVREHEHFFKIFCARSQTSLGDLFLERRRANEAVVILRKSFKMQRSILGESSLDTCRTIKSLTIALKEQGATTPETFALMHHAFNTVSQHPASDAFERMVFRATLGLLMHSSGPSVEASQHLRTLIGEFNALESFKLSALVDVRILLTALATATGSAHGGSQGLNLLLPTADHLQHIQHFDAARWRARCGLALKDHGRLDEAQANLIQAVHVARKRPLVLDEQEVTAIEMDLARLRL